MANQDGTGSVQLTDLFGDSDAAWSPDGSRIAFTRWHGGDFGSREIYTINADATNLQRITNNEFDDNGPVWSTDGNNLAFVSNRAGAYSVFLMNVDGSSAISLESNVTRLSFEHSFNPKWLPDGKNIAFTSDRYGTQDVFIVDVESILKQHSPVRAPLVAIQPPSGSQIGQ